MNGNILQAFINLIDCISTKSIRNAFTAIKFLQPFLQIIRNPIFTYSGNDGLVKI